MSNKKYKLTFDLYDGRKKTVEFEVPQGDPGRGIVSVTRTAGTGEAGTVDTYTIMFTDNTTSEIFIYNGADGKDGKNADLTGYATEEWVEEKLNAHSGGNVDVSVDGETLVIAESSTVTIEDETLIL